MTAQRINVVLLILVVVLSITFAIPFIQRQRTRQALAVSSNNLKQISMACHGANDVHKKFPPAYDAFEVLHFPTSVHVHILPFAWSEHDFAGFAKAGKVDENLVRPFFISGADPTLRTENGVQNFAANLRVFADKGVNTRWTADMPPLARIEPGTASIPRTFNIDGASNTILFASKMAECSHGGSRYAADPTLPFAAFFGQNAARVFVHRSHHRSPFQLAPRPSECATSPLMAQSFTREGILLSLADASSRIVRPTINPVVWNLAVQPNDGEFFVGD